MLLKLFLLLIIGLIHQVKRVWGTLQEARPAREWIDRTGVKLENISADDLIIWISPGETILAHTNEFIGGRHSVRFSGETFLYEAPIDDS
jgi:hypothetical protein